MNAAAPARGGRAGALRRLPADCARALRQAGQWRLLLLWLLGLALPLVLGMLPLALALSAQLDRSLAGSALAGGYDVTVVVEALRGLGEAGWTPASSLGAALVLALLLPWLGGVSVAAARAPQRLGWTALLQGGLAEYGRMLRLGLWSLVPLALLGGAGAAAVYGARQGSLQLTLQTDAERLQHAAQALAVSLLVLAQASVEAARAQLAVEPRRRSVVRAWWRGTRGVVRRPARLLPYLALTAAGVAAAALLGWLRIQVVPARPAGLLLALLLGQALVLALVWMRCARLFALAAAARE